MERLLRVFDNSGVEKRYLTMPPEWYCTPRSFAEKNEVWARRALELATLPSSDQLSGRAFPNVSVALAATPRFHTIFLNL